MSLTRRTILAAGMAAMATGALAHHGWRWTQDGNFELTGTIVEVELGNPHGKLTVDADGETWIAQVGQPWRNARAGLSEDMLEPGVALTLQGGRSADPNERLMKAERVIIDGTLYNLYPDRS